MAVDSGDSDQRAPTSQAPVAPWGEPARSEPAFNAPWTLIALCVALPALYALQTMAPDALVERFCVSRTALAAGHYETLVTSLFLHESWTHVIMNTLSALAFGAPAARLMGTGVRGSVVFLAFFVTVGIVGSAAFVLTDPNDASLGASGAVSGLLGVAARVIEGRGKVGPIFGRTVIGMTVAWCLLNVILGVFRITPGAFGVDVAWQAHVGGYLAGVLLAGVFARLAGRDGTAFTH